MTTQDDLQLLIEDLRGSAPKLVTCRDAADLIERLRGKDAATGAADAGEAK